ncbi:MAG: molybdopterin molybdotransferase MoeA [Thermodesulfobacteriota bacterium]
MLNLIGYPEALDLILRHMPAGAVESVPLLDTAGRILARDVVSQVDSPTAPSSLKDGYAVHSADLSAAGPDHPVALDLAGFYSAGDRPARPLLPGTAVRVTTGAALPPGADAVLSGEYAQERDGRVICRRDAGPGRNVLPRGADVKAGETIARKGEQLRPALIGLLAAAGLDQAAVAARLRVAVIGTGDEVVLPGRPLAPGQLYASNMVETAAWLEVFGQDVLTRLAGDRLEDLKEAVFGVRDLADAFITSGGAWGSDRDLVLNLMQNLGWQGLFHRVRLGPGKAAGFGLLFNKPFFILPGGPPSHEAAFLLLALPGLLAMGGRRDPAFPFRRARLTEAVQGQPDWTKVIHARLEFKADHFIAAPIKSISRLKSMAEKNGLVILPEGTGRVDQGAWVEVLDLNRPAG